MRGPATSLPSKKRGGSGAMRLAILTDCAWNCYSATYFTIIDATHLSHADGLHEQSMDLLRHSHGKDLFYSVRLTGNEHVMNGHG